MKKRLPWANHPSIKGHCQMRWPHREGGRRVNSRTLSSSLPSVSFWSSPSSKSSCNPGGHGAYRCDRHESGWRADLDRQTEESHAPTALVFIQGHQISSKDTVGSKIQNRVPFWFHPSILLGQHTCYLDYLIEHSFLAGFKSLGVNKQMLVWFNISG